MCCTLKHTSQEPLVFNGRVQWTRVDVSLTDPRTAIPPPRLLHWHQWWWFYPPPLQTSSPLASTTRSRSQRQGQTKTHQSRTDAQIFRRGKHKRTYEFSKQTYQMMFREKSTLPTASVGCSCRLEDISSGSWVYKLKVSQLSSPRWVRSLSNVTSIKVWTRLTKVFVSYDHVFAHA